jgi:hypothetical protein
VTETTIARRSTDLLKKAADALDDGQSPLANPFLSENDVSLDECYNLAEQLAMGARLFAWALENPKMAAAAMDGAATGMSVHLYTTIIKKLAGQ